MGASGTVKCHTSPEMNLTYSVSDDGNYSVSVEKPGKGKFGYKWELKVNDGTVITKSTSDGNEGTWNSGNVTGNCGTSFKVTATCYSAEGCSIAGTTGKGPHTYTVVDTINLHVHSTPDGGNIHLHEYLNKDSGDNKTDASVSRHTKKIVIGIENVSNWGCTTEGESWVYSLGSDAWSSPIGKDSTATISTDNPGDVRTISVRIFNAHGSTRERYHELPSATFRTRYATPSLGTENTNPLIYGPGSENYNVSNDTNSISINVSNSVSNCGTLTYYYKIGNEKEVSSDSNKHTFTGLTAGTLYSIEVYAKNPDGDESASLVFNIRTRYNKPSITLSNVNKRLDKDNVSNSTNSIKVSVSSSTAHIGTTFTYYFKIDNGQYVNNGNKSTYTFTGLKPGTTHTITACIDTEDGVSTRSDEKSITIRTCYDASNFTKKVGIADIGLENVIFSPTIVYGNDGGTIASATYKITGGLAADKDGCDNTNLTINSNHTIKQQNSGYCLTPNTKYTITISVTTIDSYDRVSFSFTQDFTSDAKSSFSKNIGNVTFAMPGDVVGTFTIKNPSGNGVRCILYAVNASSGQYQQICHRDFSSGWNASQNLILNDNEWDDIYKIIGNSKNTIQYLWRVVTYSNRKKAYPELSSGVFHSENVAAFTLNGKKKTLHIGTGNHRAAVFMGVKSGNTTAVKRAVIWVGDSNGKPHRCI